MSSALKSIKISVEPLKSNSIVSGLTSTTTGSTSGGHNNDKYSFNGTTYGKSPLVHAVIKQFVFDNPKLTYNELKKLFPKKLQGSKGVLISKKDYDAIPGNDKSNRYKVDKPLKLISETTPEDDIIYVCTQWGIGNIGNFISQAENLGYKIDKV